MKKQLIITSWILSIVFLSTLLSADDQQIHISRLKEKKIVIILPKRFFHDISFSRVNEIFVREGAEIIIASSTLSDVYGVGGLGRGRKPNVLVKNIIVEEIDAIVFIGGAGCLQYLSDYSALNLVKQAMAQNKILAAINLAPRILAEADVLKGKKVTSALSEKTNLKEKGAIVTHKDVEVDGNLITATEPSVANQFGEVIVSALSKR